MPTQNNFGIQQTLKINVDSSRAIQSLTRITSILDRLEKNTDVVNKKLRITTFHIEKLNKLSDVFNKRFRDLGRTVNTNVRGINRMYDSFKNINKETQQTYKNTNRAFDTRKTNAYSNSLFGITRRFNSLAGSIFWANLGVSKLLQGFNSLVTLGGQFEKQENIFASLAKGGVSQSYLKKSGLSESEVIKNTLLQSRNIAKNLPTTPSETTATLVSLLKAGQEVQNTPGIAEAVIKLKNASGVTQDVATQSFINSIAQFDRAGKTGGNNIAEYLYKTQTLSTAGIRDIGSSIPRVEGLNTAIFQNKQFELASALAFNSGVKSVMQGRTYLTSSGRLNEMFGRMHSKTGVEFADLEGLRTYGNYAINQIDKQGFGDARRLERNALGIRPSDEKYLRGLITFLNDDANFNKINENAKLLKKSTNLLQDAFKSYETTVVGHQEKLTSAFEEFKLRIFDNFKGDYIDLLSTVTSKFNLDGSKSLATGIGNIIGELLNNINTWIEGFDVEKWSKKFIKITSFLTSSITGLVKALSNLQYTFIGYQSGSMLSKLTGNFTTGIHNYATALSHSQIRLQHETKESLNNSRAHELAFRNSAKRFDREKTRANILAYESDRKRYRKSVKLAEGFSKDLETIQRRSTITAKMIASNWFGALSKITFYATGVLSAFGFIVDAVKWGMNNLKSEAAKFKEGLQNSAVSNITRLSYRQRNEDWLKTLVRIPKEYVPGAFQEKGFDIVEKQGLRKAAFGLQRYKDGVLGDNFKDYSSKDISKAIVNTLDLDDESQISRILDDEKFLNLVKRANVHGSVRFGYGIQFDELKHLSKLIGENADYFKNLKGQSEPSPTTDGTIPTTEDDTTPSFPSFQGVDESGVARGLSAEKVININIAELNGSKIETINTKLSAEEIDNLIMESSNEAVNILNKKLLQYN